MSKIKVNEIEAQTGSTITIPTGQSLVVTDGLSTSSLPTIPVSKGGTGLTSVGTAGQVLAVNSGATALEFADASSGKIYEVYYNSFTDVQTISGSAYTWYDITNLSRTITPQSASSKFWIHCRISTGANGNHQYTALNCGGSLVHINTAPGSRLATSSTHAAKTTWDQADQVFSYLWSPATTSPVTIKAQAAFESLYIYINRGDRDDNALYDARSTSDMTIFELTS